MAKSEVKMGVDPFRVLRTALAKSKRHPALGSIISIDNIKDNHPKWSEQKVLE